MSGEAGTSMHLLTVYGAIAVSLMLLFYALEHRSSWFIAAFAAACLASSSYGFLQGAWPFGVVEFIWSIVALRRWLHVRGGKAGVHVPMDF